jgi:hypothetical protein
VALAAALEEARNSGASHYVSMAQGNLALVDAAIEEGYAPNRRRFR